METSSCSNGGCNPLNLKFSLFDETKGVPNVTSDSNKYYIYYPCESTTDCTPYFTTLPSGTYYIELYGASGGSSTETMPFRFQNNSFLDIDIVKRYNGNTVNNENITYQSISGSGGYTAGVLIVPKETVFYIRLGGKGGKKSSNGISNSVESESDEVSAEGGYNGGGRGLAYSSYHNYGGGGATDIRAEYDDEFHRIMVAGAGGSCDKYLCSQLSQNHSL